MINSFSTVLWWCITFFITFTFFLSKENQALLLDLKYHDMTEINFTICHCSQKLMSNLTSCFHGSFSIPVLPNFWIFQFLHLTISIDYLQGCIKEKYWNYRFRHCLPFVKIRRGHWYFTAELTSEQITLVFPFLTKHKIFTILRIFEVKSKREVDKHCHPSLSLFQTQVTAIKWHW